MNERMHGEKEYKFIIKIKIITVKNFADICFLKYLALKENGHHLGGGYFREVAWA